jgi:hypothetical protein
MVSSMGEPYMSPCENTVVNPYQVSSFVSEKGRRRCVRRPILTGPKGEVIKFRDVWDPGKWLPVS